MGHVSLLGNQGAVIPVAPFLSPQAEVSGLPQGWNRRSQRLVSNPSGSDATWAPVGFTVLQPRARSGAHGGDPESSGKG